MATVPVPVNQSFPHAAATPDLWRSLRPEMDRLFDSFTEHSGVSTSFRNRFEIPIKIASPAVDITEEESAFKVTAEVPGMSETDIEVPVSGDTLMIKGETRQEREEKADNRYLSERACGEFQRAFTLHDNVDREKITASFSNGVLTLTPPKIAQASLNKIEIKTAG